MGEDGRGAEGGAPGNQRSSTGSGARNGARNGDRSGVRNGARKGTRNASVDMGSSTKRCPKCHVPIFKDGEIWAEECRDILHEG